MQARKIDLTPYTTELEGDPYLAGDEFVTRMFKRKTDPKIWLRKYISAPAAGHSAKELLAAMDLVGKIRAAKDHVLLEEADWTTVCTILNKIKGYGLSDVKIVRRVLEAPVVEVDEKKD